MNSQTVDFGIDLGTTNSAIARATPRGLEIVKNGRMSEVTPSAVSKSRSGQLYVGQDALDRMLEKTATKFKRLMGSPVRLELDDGTAMSPEELSAEILKELKGLVMLRYDFPLEHAVITVPAMFQQPQCEATNRAAQLAGFEAATLLQEPIAAATAYLSDAREDGNYVVYDLGGGTFDVSVVRLRDRRMSILAHGGNNQLGGADFDRRILDWVVDQLGIDRVGRVLASDRDRFILERACEAAKIRLSVHNHTYIDIGDLDIGVPQVPFDRETLEDLIADIVSQTIALARERIREAGCTAEGIRGVILVGGPTMTPVVRSRLRAELGINLMLDHDPMTVVAAGAARHASSLLAPNRAAMHRASGDSLRLELYYDPVCTDVRSNVSGKIVEPAGFDGDVRITSASGDWDTGWMPLVNGAFACQVYLGDGDVSTFRVSARLRDGSPVAVVPESFSIRLGTAPARPITPYNYGVVLEGGKQLAIVVPEGRPLPAHGSASLLAARTVQARSLDELWIYFVEGKSDVPEDNHRVGTLIIRGTDLTRTLPEGERVEVRIRMDESRLLVARVFVPLLDLDYRVELTSVLTTPDTADLIRLFRSSLEDLGVVEGVAEGDEIDTLLQLRREIEALEADFERLSQGEPGEAERIYQRICHIRPRLRLLRKKHELQILYNEVLETAKAALSISEANGDRVGAATSQDVLEAAERSLRLQDRKGLEALRETASDVFWRHYVRTDECWTGLVQYLRANRPLATEPAAFHAALMRAEECLQRSDYSGVRLHGLEAMRLLPDTEGGKGAFYNAGLRR